MSMCEGPGGSYAGSVQDALTQLGAAPGMAGPIFPPGRPYNTLFSQSNKCKQKLQGCLKLSLKLGGHAVSAEMHSPGLSKPQGEPKCIRRGNIQFLFYGKSSKLTLQKGSAQRDELNYYSTSVNNLKQRFPSLSSSCSHNCVGGGQPETSPEIWLQAHSVWCTPPSSLAHCILALATVSETLDASPVTCAASRASSLPLSVTGDQSQR